MKLMQSVFLFALSVTHSTLATAAVHYIRAGATGNGSSWTNALPDLPSALVRGDTYYMASGTYAGHTFNDPESGTMVILIKKAIVADHGTAPDWRDSYGIGSVIFNGTLVFERGYYELDGQVGGGPSGWTSGHGIQVLHSAKQGVKLIKVSNTGVVVSNLNFKHIELGYTPCGPREDVCRAQDAVYAVEGGANLNFQNCYIHDGGRTLLYTTSISGILIDKCMLARNGRVQEYYYCDVNNVCSWKSLHSEAWSARRTKNVVVRDSWVQDFRSTGGIIMGWADDWDFFGNIFQWTQDFGATSNNGAIGSWGSDATYYVNRVNVYNNTFVGLRSGGSGEVLVDRALPNTNVKVYNNIWFNSPAVGIGSDIIHDHNTFINSNGTAITEANKLSGAADPFVSFATNNFRLKAPMSGLALDVIYGVDMYGSRRGGDRAWDRGAIEYGGNVDSLAPRAPAGVAVK